MLEKSLRVLHPDLWTKRQSLVWALKATPPSPSDPSKGCHSLVTRHQIYELVGTVLIPTTLPSDVFGNLVKNIFPFRGIELLLLPCKVLRLFSLLSLSFPVRSGPMVTGLCPPLWDKGPFLVLEKVLILKETIRISSTV